MPKQNKDSKNIHCLNCHRADVDFLSYLKQHFGCDKVFVGFIQGSTIAVSLSPEITYSDGLVIADTVRHLVEEF